MVGLVENSFIFLNCLLDTLRYFGQYVGASRIFFWVVVVLGSCDTFQSCQLDGVGFVQSWPPEDERTALS